VSQEVRVALRFGGKRKTKGERARKQRQRADEVRASKAPLRVAVRNQAHSAAASRRCCAA
jgi:hypothetical protein